MDGLRRLRAWMVGVLALATLATAPALAAAPRARLIAAGERAAARTAPHPDTARFRNVAAHGDIVCGEMDARDGTGAYHGFQPFYAYAAQSAWTVHQVHGQRGLKEGLACFDQENAKGRKIPACAGYDFDFYFAWDHFCR